MKKKVALFWIALSFSYFATAQHHYTVSGIIRDKNTGEVLISATAYLPQLINAGAVSNNYGFYSLTAPAGEYTLIISYLGYQQDSVKVVLDKNLRLNVGLIPNGSSLKEVVISGQNKNRNVTEALAGVQQLSINEIKNVPVIFGEQDVLKTIQLLPGIKSAGDGSSGFYVRGGATDQNLILLDGAVVYNPFHLLGFFSAFNSDAINDVTLYKSAMPAEYGGRLSSVLDIRMKDGNDQNYVVSGGLGLIDSRLTVQGPIVKNKGSFIVTARRTYADLFLKLSPDTTLNRNSLYFYDLNAKANYTLNENNRVYLSGYFGKDNFGLANTFSLNYGNSTATARWNHIFNSRLFSNTSFIYNNYYYNIALNSSNNNLFIKSLIEDISLKEDFQYYLNSRNEIRFGFDAIHHAIAPGILEASATSNFNSQHLPKKYAWENAVYISDEFSANDHIKLYYGLRFSAFSIVGPGSFYTYDSTGNATDTATYSSGQIVKTYINLEPRLSVNFLLNKISSIKVSYTRNTQNLHLLSNSTFSNPTDLWIPSSLNVKPEIADQISLGYYRNFKSGQYEFSAETYYKSLQNQIDYKNGARLVANGNVESELLYGIGKDYGLELYLKKKTGKLTGWVSYTLSKAALKINGINNNNWYPATQDQPNNIAIVAMYQLNKKWTLSSDWVYNTGDAVTFPSGKYDINGQTVFYYTERNGYRMPAYHRLDFAATLQNKKRRKWETSWTFSLYNVYGRRNAYLVQFENDPNDPEKTQAEELYLFQWVPSVTYNFKF